MFDYELYLCCLYIEGYIKEDIVIPNHLFSNLILVLSYLTLVFGMINAELLQTCSYTKLRL